MAKLDDLIVPDAHIGFKNFSGKPSNFNTNGKRNFCVFFDDLEYANDLKLNGWNIKFTKQREPDDEQTAYLPVEVRFDYVPPKIVLVTSKNQTILDEESVGMLDWAEIKNIDLVINPYQWEMNGNTGIKAYVKSMYVTIAEDPFADKYSMNVN